MKTQQAKRIYVPSSGTADWQQLLAKPDLHWRKGYSARALANCWESSDGFPKEISKLFKESEFPKLKDIECLLAIPEHKVALPGGITKSQSDIFILAKAGKELVSMVIEGKVSESFGPTLGEWHADGRSSKGKDERLAYLKNQLGICNDLPCILRYQLLHRAASAIIEAKKFNASIAVMIVHSFSQRDAWFEDYAAFLEILGSRAQKGSLSLVKEIGGIELFCGWASGQAKFLDI